MKIFINIILITLLLFINIYSQNESDSYRYEMEIFLIDAYVRPEPPFIFILTYYTSDVCLSNVIIDGKYEFPVSDSLTESHKTKIDISELKFLDKNVNFIIETIDSSGNKFKSEEFEFDLPYEPVIKEGSSLLTLCLFAGSVFLIPAPGYVIKEDGNYFSLTKEIPVISFRSRSRNYPAGYLTFEFTYIFDAASRNYLRFGYKRIFETGFLEYISPGITAYTNFNGQNGFAPELSIGLFTMFDTFTLYTRYRYNFKPGDADKNFHEINLGLYTRFFSIYL